MGPEIIIAVATALAGLAGAYVAFTKFRDWSAAKNAGRTEASLERAEEEAKRAREAQGERSRVESLTADELELGLNRVSKRQDPADR